ncbi:bifunctional folylpolyglutamate synthase/dihydrofolate synthase [Dyadobacter aurulentus]|uniref:bifunctional folylpolyglutamate synthase/dihydrofolate synthase n=1 Tax=Dyadobacter sp. UC 10 TaxID=2605428 RepID=UPI0011F0A9B0|nr:folylpolyglutamate synthase/dihydrofolate synthase family protein [Dyadobacter sp. UC 10]KAA0993237.1 bifunctional folylpolyglutamate synthase/dihydrofolate synthase [Dyadobacter sp. UC 10]
MNYQETLDYLYSRLPVFQNVGARAFKPGLHTTRALCESLGDPQNTYPTIHVGGTNGKGSTSHMLAAILQNSGYKVGLYTSPHLKDFRERIRINGKCVGEDFVISFTDEIKSNIERFNPSFFEVTVAMAFKYFADHKVDIAVIEVGMGGRLDSTNIVEPIVSVITNVSLDHTQFLGETLSEIASEKAGIIKQNVPVIVSEYQSQEVAGVFINKAQDLDAPLAFGSQVYQVKNQGISHGLAQIYARRDNSDEPGQQLRLDLTGSYQTKNLAGVLTVRDMLVSLGWKIESEDVSQALKDVVSLTGLKGRWQQLGHRPDVYCDTAHNIGGLTDTIAQFTSLPHERLRFVMGFVKDKDISSILGLLPVNAVYYFCEPSNLRALNATDLATMAARYGLVGKTFQNVNEALKQAIAEADDADIIYVGGSTFVVADLDQL